MLLHKVNREMANAKQKAYDELCKKLDTNKGEHDLYQLVRWREHTWKDVEEVWVIKVRDGKVC